MQWPGVIEGIHVGDRNGTRLEITESHAPLDTPIVHEPRRLAPMSYQKMNGHRPAASAEHEMTSGSSPNAQ